MAEHALHSFLAPLRIDEHRLHYLAHEFAETYANLAATSLDQFLPTPISVLPTGREQGRYLAIDIGGTNLRVAFAELIETSGDQRSIPKSNNIQQHSTFQDLSQPQVQRTHEKAWPIAEHLKNEKAEDLFAWIGSCIAEVVRDGFHGSKDDSLDLGVTFSFPMIQRTLSDATLMSMGKGFAITSNLDLAKQLLDGYQKANTNNQLPKISIAAITNDSVATLVSLAYRFNSKAHSRPVMGIIVGTGTNATLPVNIGSLHASKHPAPDILMGARQMHVDRKIVVNTEWSINGAAPPLRNLNMVTRWDTILDAEAEAPGFQPFEYMTAGRYLGELGRIILVDYFTRILNIPSNHLPPRMLTRNGLSTVFFGNLRITPDGSTEYLIDKLAAELPPATSHSIWTVETARAAQMVAKAIEVRAAGLTAAAIIGLLGFAGEIKLSPQKPAAPSNSALIPVESIDGCVSTENADELVVGYTGGCINHFQDYLADCQNFLDEIVALENGHQGIDMRKRVILEPCNYGGIDGAGILAGMVESSAREN